MPEPTVGRIPSQNLSVNHKAHQRLLLAETPRRTSAYIEYIPMLRHLTLPGVQPTTGQGSWWPRSVDSLMPRCTYVQSPKQSNTIQCNNSGLMSLAWMNWPKEVWTTGKTFRKKEWHPVNCDGNWLATSSDGHMTEFKRFRAASRSTIWRNGPHA